MMAFVGQMINMKYGQEDELESDWLGLRFWGESGYDRRALIGVMKILDTAGGSINQRSLALILNLAIVLQKWNK